MQIQQLKSNKNQKRRKRVGRGGTRGNYCGKGKQGQNSRAGSSRRPAILDFIRKIPKLRGVPAKRYKKQGVKRFRKIYEIVNVDVLENRFKDSEVVSPQALLEKKLIRRINGRMPNVKILGRGELKKRITFQGVELSRSVKERVK